MQEQKRYTRRLEIFALVVSLFILIHTAFIYAVSFFIGPLLDFYQLALFIAGTFFSLIPVAAGLLLNNRVWKVVLIVLGLLMWAVKIFYFLKNTFL